MGQLQRISSSAHRIVATFLSIPGTVAVHLPTTSYTIVWYGLLVLSKLSLLFPNDAAEPLGLDNRKIRDVGIAITQRIGSFSQGGDVWENSKRVVGSMLLWLEKSKPETRHTAFENTSPMAVARNMSDYTAPDKAQLNLLSEASDDVDCYQDTWPMIEIPDQMDAAAYIEAHVAMNWDASLWQGMFESLTWPNTSIDDQSVFQ